MKNVEESLLTDETFNEDIEKTAKNVKSSEEAAEVINKLDKIFKSSNCSSLWLACQQSKIFEKNQNEW